MSFFTTFDLIGYLTAGPIRPGRPHADRVPRRSTRRTSIPHDDVGPRRKRRAEREPGAGTPDPPALLGRSIGPPPLQTHPDRRPGRRRGRVEGRDRRLFRSPQRGLVHRQQVARSRARP